MNNYIFDVKRQRGENIVIHMQSIKSPHTTQTVICKTLPSHKKKSPKALPIYLHPEIKDITIKYITATTPAPNIIKL